MKTWWLSFADPQRPKGSQLLGVALVRADNFPLAVLAAHFHKCNPGGECAGVECPAELADVLKPDEIGVLISPENVERFDRTICRRMK